MVKNLWKKGDLFQISTISTSYVSLIFYFFSSFDLNRLKVWLFLPPVKFWFSLIQEAAQAGKAGVEMGEGMNFRLGLSLWQRILHGVSKAKLTPETKPLGFGLEDVLTSYHQPVWLTGTRLSRVKPSWGIFSLLEKEYREAEALSSRSDL